MAEGERGDGIGLVYHVGGELVPAAEASVNVRDRGFLYGDAAFETLRAYGGELFEWGAHADRLAGTCEALGLEHGISSDELRDRVEETLAANDLADAYVRLSITRGVQPGKLTPRTAVEPTVVVIVAPLPRGGPDGEATWDEPARVAVAETRRIPASALPARAKTHNYLNGVLARLECRGTDADEAIMLDGVDALTEGATSNLFFVEDGVLRTPSLEGPVLPGVTREVVLELARGAGIATEEGTYALEELLDAEEAFLTNTTWEIRPVASVDGTALGGGPTTDRLRRAFDERVATHYGSRK